MEEESWGGRIFFVVLRVVLRVDLIWMFLFFFVNFLLNFPSCSCSSLNNYYRWLAPFTSRVDLFRTPFDWWPCRRAGRDIRTCRALRAAWEGASRDCWARISNCAGSSDCTDRTSVPRERASTCRVNSAIRCRCASETRFHHLLLLLLHLLHHLRLRRHHLLRLRLLVLWGWWDCWRCCDCCSCDWLLPFPVPLGTSAIFRIEIPV